MRQSGAPWWVCTQPSAMRSKCNFLARRRMRSNGQEIIISFLHGYILIFRGNYAHAHEQHATSRHLRDGTCFQFMRPSTSTTLFARHASTILEGFVLEQKATPGGYSNGFGWHRHFKPQHFHKALNAGKHAEHPTRSHATWKRA
jgi:hypothetical protein